jgi:hypothetical protein
MQNEYLVSNPPDPCMHRLNIQSVVCWTSAYAK